MILKKLSIGWFSHILALSKGGRKNCYSGGEKIFWRKRWDTITINIFTETAKINYTTVNNKPFNSLIQGHVTKR